MTLCEGHIRPDRLSQAVGAMAPRAGDAQGPRAKGATINFAKDSNKVNQMSNRPSVKSGSIGSRCGAPHPACARSRRRPQSRFELPKASIACSKSGERLRKLALTFFFS